MQVTGLEGAVMVGHIVAAPLVSWSLTSGEAPGSYRFTGKTGPVDEFWSTQSPRSVRVTVGTQTWRWREVNLEIGDGRVEGTLIGRPEVR